MLHASIFPEEGKPIDIYYTKQPESDYIKATVVTILQTHIAQPEGDILAFFCGQEDIETTMEIITKNQLMRKLNWRTYSASNLFCFAIRHAS